MKFLKRRKSAPPVEFLPAEPLESVALLELIEILRKAAAHGHESENREKADEALRLVDEEILRRSHRDWVRVFGLEDEVFDLRCEVEAHDRLIARLLGEPRGWRFGPGCCGPYGYLLRRWKEERE